MVRGDGCLRRPGEGAGPGASPFLADYLHDRPGISSLDPQKARAQACAGSISSHLLEFSVSTRIRRVQGAAPGASRGLGFRANAAGNGQGCGPENPEVEAHFSEAPTLSVLCEGEGS